MRGQHTLPLSLAVAAAAVVVVVAALLHTAAPCTGLPVNGTERWYRNPWKGPLVLPEHRLVVCSIPKCGSTTLRRLVARLAGFPHWREGNVHAWLHARDRGRLHLGGARPVAEANRVLLDPAWRRVALVRHPVPRLLSAYLSKVVPHHGWKYGRNLTFAEFVGRVLNETSTCVDRRGRRSFLNEHWDFQQCFCGLQAARGQYDVFVLEEAPRLVRSLLDSGHLPEAAAAHGWPSHVEGDDSLFNYRSLSNGTLSLETRHRTADLVGRYYTPQLLAAVVGKFAKDFAFFGFDPHRYDAAVAAAHRP